MFETNLRTTNLVPAVQLLNNACQEKTQATFEQGKDTSVFQDTPKCLQIHCNGNNKSRLAAKQMGLNKMRMHNASMQLHRITAVSANRCKQIDKLRTMIADSRFAEYLKSVCESCISMQANYLNLFPCVNTFITYHQLDDKRRLSLPPLLVLKSAQIARVYERVSRFAPACNAATLQPPGSALHALVQSQ